MTVDNIYSQFKISNQTKVDSKKQPAEDILTKQQKEKHDEFKSSAQENNTNTYLAIIGGLAAIGLGIFAYIKLKQASLKSALKKISQHTPQPEQRTLPPPVPSSSRIINEATVQEKQAAFDRLYAFCQSEAPDELLRVRFIDNDICFPKGNIMDTLYNKLRIAQYQQEGLSTIAEITRNGTSKTEVIPDLHWHFRIPINAQRSNRHCVERISLNVRPEKELIEQLDKYFSEHINIQGEYKTPSTFRGWSSRHDPITIYFYEPIKDKKVLDDIAQIAKPFVRSTGNEVLVGNKFAPGCAWQLSPTPKQYQELRERIIPYFGEISARRICSDSARLSAGEFYTLNQIINKITGQEIDHLMPANLPGM